MKIVITGNMGYVGPCVVQRLRTSYPNAMCVGLDMGYFANCITTSAILPECRVDLQYFADVRNLPETLLEDVEAVVHLAAISNDPMGIKFENVTFDINYQASIRLAQMAKAAGVKSFVYASSCSIYGTSESGQVTENSPLNPLSAYAQSKIMAEQHLKNLASDDFKITSLRFSTACGMSERLRLDLVLNDFVAAAVASKRITILSDGTPWRPLIDVKDMARAIDWAIVRDRADGGSFLAVNVGRDQANYQVKELARAVAEVIPDVDIIMNRSAGPDKRSYRVNFDMFKALAPDHQPQVELMTSVRELKQGLESIHFNDTHFRDTRLVRLKVLTDLRDSAYLDANLHWNHDRHRTANLSKNVQLEGIPYRQHSATPI